MAMESRIARTRGRADSADGEDSEVAAQGALPCESENPLMGSNIGSADLPQLANEPA